MGLIILDEIDTPVGIKMANLTASVRGGYHLIPRETVRGKIYEIHTKIYYFVSRNAAQHLYDEALTLKIPAEKIKDPYELVYEHLKAKYPNSVRC